VPHTWSTYPSNDHGFAHWPRWRWVLWVLGTSAAVAFAYYWIADEIYPFVRAA
jgi:hypothetical protein